MRVLITGGAGFVGSHLTDRLAEAGHDVVVLDNLLTGQVANLTLGERQSGGRVELIEADVCDGVSVGGRFDRIYHLASPASPIHYLRLPFATLDVSSVGLRVLLDRAVTDGARVLFASTSEVYGDPAVHPQPESYWGNVNPIGPRSVYDEAKRFGEALMMAYQRHKGVETRIVRIFNTYGPRMRPDDGRVIPTFIRQALRGEPLTVFGDGLQTRSFCYVDDLVDGLVRLMESDLTEPCNVGNPTEMTMLQLAEAITRLTRSPSGVVHKPLPTDDPTRRRPDITRAGAELGWAPQVSFEDGLARTVDWFRDEGLADPTT